MAHASKKNIGAGSQGKGSGSGAGSTVDKDKVGDNMPLSNRDKSQHSRGRGYDSKAIQSEQRQDHESNKIDEDD